MHHAYLILGGREEARESATSLVVNLGGDFSNNPDIHIFETEVFTVDNARDLIGIALGKAFGERRFFLIHADVITREAQNTLLKTLEEPIENAHFLITAREKGLFIPTLLSRLFIIESEEAVQEASEIEKFFKKSLKQRIEFAKKFADEERSLVDFLDNTLTYLRSKGEKTERLKKILNLRKYAHDSGAMSRLMLEHLALVL